MSESEQHPQGAPAPEPTNATPPAQASREPASLGGTCAAFPQVRIIVDSCGDFDPEVARALGVEVLSFTYVIDGVEYYDDLWQSMSAHEFYDQLRAGKQATTAAVSAGRYYELFERCATEGTPTIYLGLTRGLSSSIETACEVAEIVREAHPGFELYALDNLCPSATAELLVIEVVRQAAAGLSASQLVEFAREARYYVQGYFTLDNFDALARGGRIPPAAASVGNMLNVKPELSYDLHGALTLRGMCRGRKKALRAILADFDANYEPNPSGEVLPIAIVSSDAPKDAEWVAEQVRKRPGCADVPIIFSSVSPVIGSHTGPGMVGLGFWGKDRRDGASISERIARAIRGSDKNS